MEINSDMIIILFGVLFGLMIVALLAAAIAKAARNASDGQCPEQTAYGVVVEKSTLPANAIPQFSSITVVFDLEDGSRRSFVVKATEPFVVGDRGMLTWQGKSSRQFKRDANNTRCY